MRTARTAPPTIRTVCPISSEDRTGVTSVSFDSDPLAFGRLLRRHRLKRGLSQEALAERASLSADGVGMLERGVRRKPYEQTVDSLARALKLRKHDRATFLSVARSCKRSQPSRHLARLPVPTPLTPLIGREFDIAELQEWLRVRGPRIVTITGTGGVGKTRLALALAHDLRASFDGEVVFISLASLHDPANIVATILGSLDRKDDGSPASLALLCGLVGKRRALFVIDNIEHVLAGVAAISDFLERCPEVVVLATSREALRFHGEHELALQPLGIRSAVELFFERARTSGRHLSREDEEAAVIEICTRLDCLPLAIELAAARLRWEPVQTLLTEIGSPLSALVFGARSAPPRQRTMRATIDWSYHLLSEQERTTLCICAMFAGVGSMEAVRAVAAAGGAGNTDSAMMALADKHLLRLSKSHPSEGRFEMLEVIREYGRERFDSFSYARACERAFVAYYAELVWRSTRSVGSVGSDRWIDFVSGEYMNICAALRWSVTHDRFLGLRIALALPGFWKRKGLFAEARVWLETLAEPLDETIEREGPLDGWRAVTALGLSYHWTGDNARACALHRQALAMASSLSDSGLISKSLNNLGIALLCLHRQDEARPVLEQALALKEGRDDAWSIGSTVGNLGIAFRMGGEYDKALKCHRRARSLFHSISDECGEIEELNLIGDVYRDRRDHRKAASHYAASLKANVEGIRTAVAHSLEGFVAIAAMRREFRRAAMLAGAVTQIHREIGHPDPPAAANFEKACAAARASLGDLCFEDALKIGAEMAIPAAIEAARTF
jgi:predicted ATPase/DNA-binding XRE family transcriptional regulator